MLKQLKILSMVVLLIGIFSSVANAATPPWQESEGQEYVVQTDDWLSSLAEKYLGDGDQWQRIVEATNALAADDARLTPIEDPDLIYPGQIIFIPTAAPGLVVGDAPELETVSLAVFCADQHPTVQAFCSEIPIARVHFDPNESAEFFTCASRAGLAAVQIDQANEVTVLVPNNGDFDLRGIATSIKVTQDGVYLVPRWSDGKFSFSAEFVENYELPAGEPLALPFTKAIELIKDGELSWTGSYGDPGRAGLYQTDPVLTCDPQADFEVEINPFKPTESETESE